MWNSFAGYRDLYGQSPPVSLVRKVRLHLLAQLERNAEIAAAQREAAAQQQEEHARRMRELGQNRGR